MRVGRSGSVLRRRATGAARLAPSAERRRRAAGRFGLGPPAGRAPAGMVGRAPGRQGRARSGGRQIDQIEVGRRDFGLLLFMIDRDECSCLEHLSWCPVRA